MITTALIILVLITMILVMILISYLIEQTKIYSSKNTEDMEIIADKINELVDKHNGSSIDDTPVPVIIGYDISTKELYMEVSHDIKLTVDNINNEDRQSCRDEFKGMCNAISEIVMGNDMHMAKFLVNNDTEYCKYVDEFDTVIITHYSGSYVYVQKFTNCRSNIEYSDNMVRSIDSINMIMNTKEEN